MAAPRNKLKAALADGARLEGLWLNLGSDNVAEIAGMCGFDWCLIDAEHGPWDPVGIQAQLRTLEPTPAEAIVRVPAAETWILKQVLDLGAQTILVPIINTPQEAQAVVRACRYPPEGIRGNGASVARATRFGAIQGYQASANAEICVIVQIETAEAVANIEAIAAVEGIDGLFIGPADLAADMGYLAEPDHPDMQAAIKDAILRIHAAGKPSGIVSHSDETRARYRALGVNLQSLGGDAGVLREALLRLPQ
ncbi:MAG: HpcH/HpaI aldolase/citrate lyase family protein [Pseudomonadota bacterium]